MPEECTEQQRAAERAGDKYYRTFTSWLTARKRNEEQKRKAFLLARAYDRALDALRWCLERMRRRPGAKQKLEYTEELQARLKQEMKVLGATRGPLTSQTDET